ncbi:MAG TPA: hypothetical protein VJ020_05195 [Anaerolineales bacterium]|nr:hypothetical protein [Anaerolineales bacterium]
MKVVVVGLGEPKHARAVCGRLAPSVECLSNRHSETHRTYGVMRGSILQLAGPQVVMAAVGAAGRGVMQGAATGDTAMLGATFIVDRQGIIRHAHYDRFVGDNPNIREMLKSYVAARDSSGEM